jgi:hypothetical protein
MFYYLTDWPSGWFHRQLHFFLPSPLATYNAMPNFSSPMHLSSLRCFLHTPRTLSSFI